MILHTGLWFSATFYRRAQHQTQAEFAEFDGDSEDSVPGKSPTRKRGTFSTPPTLARGIRSRRQRETGERLGLPPVNQLSSLNTEQILFSLDS